MANMKSIDLTLLAAGAARAATLLRLLGHEKRLMLLCMLGEGERSVGELQSRLDLSQSALSQHLARLRADGLVAARREGQSVFYRIADPAVSRMIATLADIYCPAPAQEETSK